MRKGQLLQGLHGYFYDNFEPRALFKKTIKQFDNNVVFFLVALLCMVLSLYVTTNSVNIRNLSDIYDRNKVLIENSLPRVKTGSSTTFPIEYYLRVFTDVYKQVDNRTANTFKFFNAFRFRFFAMKNCETTTQERNLAIFFENNSVSS